MDVTAQNLQNRVQKLHNVHQDTYNVLLKNALTFINMQSNLGAQTCYYTVPVVLPGHALFPYEPAMDFLIAQLQKRGFQVSRHGPQILYISWMFLNTTDASGSSGVNMISGDPKKRKLPKKYTAFLKKKV